MTFGHDDAKLRAGKNGGLVWHYTTLEGLQSILATGSLFATETSFLNDINETSTADRVFSDALAAVGAAGHDDFARNVARMLRDLDAGMPFYRQTERQMLESSRFILCASSDGDNLYAWRTYASGGISCSIGIDPALPLGVSASTPREPSEAHGWVEVIYSELDLRAEAMRHLERLAVRWAEALHLSNDEERDQELFDISFDSAPAVRRWVRSRAKDPSFSDEKELRVTVQPSSAGDVHMTSSRMGPRPHVRLVAAPRWGAEVSTAEAGVRLPIRAVRLGPDAPASASEGLQWLLLRHGYPLDPGWRSWFDDQFQRTDGAQDDWTRTILLDRSTHPYRTM